MYRLRSVRRIFGPKRDQVRGEWKKLHNEELNDLNELIIRVIIWGRIRRAGNVARME
jgi:hypothetical protein